MAAALALFTSIAYGVSNYVGPRLARETPLMLVLVVSQGCSLLAAGAVVAATGPALPSSGAVAWAVFAGIGNAAGLVFFYRAADVGPLSVITPVGSLGVAIPVAAGIASGESVATGQVIGIALALTGLLLVARRPSTGVSPVPGEVLPGADEAHTDRQRAIVLALLAAVGFGTFLAAIKPAAEDGAAFAVFLSRLGLVAILVVMALREAALAVRPPLRRLAVLALPGLLLFAGTLSYAVATRRGDLSVVSVLGSLFTVVTVGLAMTLDRERLSPVAGVGVVAAIVGVILLSAQ